jgi:hypothetical protein
MVLFSIHSVLQEEAIDLTHITEGRSEAQIKMLNWNYKLDKFRQMRVFLVHPTPNYPSCSITFPISVPI